MKSKVSILFFVLLSAISVHAGYAANFKTADLSADGQQAYNVLLNTRFFSIGLIGWGAQQSESEIALRNLLREKKAVKALKSLLQKATPEGSLYGLFGLRIINIKTFKQELAAYKLKPAPPERLRYASERPGKFNKVRFGDVIVQSGCVSINQTWLKVVERVESGEYDETFRANKTGVDYILADGTVVKPK